MKANQVAKILRQLSDILSMFGDEPLSDALTEIQHLVDFNKEKSGRNNPERQSVEENLIIEPELISRMSQMSNDELKDFLKSSDVFKSKKALMKLANALSLSVSTRGNIDSLIHTILKYFERQRLDTIIRNDRNSIMHSKPIG